MSEAGHNAVNAGQLRSYIDRVERLEFQKKEIGEDISEVYAEVKSSGFDPKIVRKIVAMRRVDDEKRKEEEAILGLYLNALGMQMGFDF